LRQTRDRLGVGRIDLEHALETITLPLHLWEGIAEQQPPLLGVRGGFDQGQQARQGLSRSPGAYEFIGLA
jgi:hypothetical protein